MNNFRAQEIKLNFLPIEPDYFSFFIYRKELDDIADYDTVGESKNISQHFMPSDLDEEGSIYKKYSVSFFQLDEYEKVIVPSTLNLQITKRFLIQSLLSKVEMNESDGKYFIGKGFKKKIFFVVDSNDLGKETIWLEPYFLSRQKRFGFLIGFHFLKEENIQFDKRIQRLSLSLSSDYKENKNYYIDYYEKITNFTSKYTSRLSPLSFNTENPISISFNMSTISANTLKMKKYIFAENKSANSQFQGIKQFGPLSKIEDDPIILFMYREQDKNLSYDLFYSLNGERYFTFPGMDKMFSFPLDNRHVSGLSINGYDDGSINEAINKIKENSDGHKILPLILVPWSRHDAQLDSDNNYYRLKHLFLKNKLPSQFVSIDKIKRPEGLKWSASNIGLAVFSKLGGKPWKISPENERCLIIGIGQAHQFHEEKISRYFAYSVLSDSSGLYDRIRVLSKSEDKTSYLNGLTEKIKRIISESSDQYDKFVLHTSFKIKRYELNAIKEAFGDNSDKTFVVMKFNDSNSFFGFSQKANGKVPFESTCLSLGNSDYLVWFEGLQYHNPVIRRRFAKPMHISFIYPEGDIDEKEKVQFLQDAINISGANWRGFNAKTFPISIYYSKIIAKYMSHFDRLNLDEIDIEGLPPWFI